MSASLVGSEMCIRDRFQVARADIRRRLEYIPARRFGFGTFQACCIAGAVSYTHLTLPTICSV
eukprot:12573896-Alexandrium_andersonii.AAC.1